MYTIIIFPNFQKRICDEESILKQLKSTNKHLQDIKCLLQKVLEKTDMAPATKRQKIHEPSIQEDEPKFRQLTMPQQVKILEVY